MSGVCTALAAHTKPEIDLKSWAALAKPTDILEVDGTRVLMELLEDRCGSGGEDPRWAPLGPTGRPWTAVLPCLLPLQWRQKEAMCSVPDFLKLPGALLTYDKEAGAALPCSRGFPRLRAPHPGTYLVRSLLSPTRQPPARYGTRACRLPAPARIRQACSMPCHLLILQVLSLHAGPPPCRTLLLHCAAAADGMCAGARAVDKGCTLRCPHNLWYRAQQVLPCPTSAFPASSTPSLRGSPTGWLPLSRANST